MNIIQALKKCRDNGVRVRPVIWRHTNEDHWVQCIGEGASAMFAEFGKREEMPHRLDLQLADDFLGEWEVVP